MLIIILILITIFPNSNTLLIESFIGCSGEYIIYTNESYIEDNSVMACDNFDGQICRVDIKEYKDLIYRIPYISSEKIVLYEYNFKDIISMLNLTIKEIVTVYDGLILYNCYTNKLPRFVSSNIGKINIQIAVSDSEINIGYPILVDY